MFRLLIVTIATAIVPNLMYAAPFIPLYGIADLSCGKYHSDISTSAQAANVYSWWLAGFVTGANVAKTRAISTDPPAHEQWIKQYCEKNPLHSFAEAAIALDKELDKRRLK